LIKISKTLLFIYMSAPDLIKVSAPDLIKIDG
jgi:hypothetical protein